MAKQMIVLKVMESLIEDEKFSISDKELLKIIVLSLSNLEKKTSVKKAYTIVKEAYDYEYIYAS